MIDLDKYEIDFKCPKCGFYNEALIKQIRLRDVIICRGCKINIRLDDQMNEVKKAVRDINKSMHELEKTFNKFSSIKIKL